jgi:hypothetical protein
MKLKLLNDAADGGQMSASFLGVMKKGQKRRRMMSMVGGGPQVDEDI